MLGNHRREDATPHVEFRDQPRISRLEGGNEVIQDPVGNCLVECAFITIGPCIELEAFEFHTFLFRDVIEYQCCKIRLARLGANAGKFGNFHVNEIVPPGFGIQKCFQLFRRGSRHSLYVGQIS